MAAKEEFVPLSKLSPQEINQFRMLRWKARTDLGFLCKEILGYPDVNAEGIHAPIVNILQKFPLPNKEQFTENDQIVNGQWVYKPLQRMTSLPGKRRALILDPRGWLKTTINAQSHSIQWIINYPDIAIQIFQSNLEKAEMILGEIKRHFQYNTMFRQLFPEHCPFKSIDDFGTKGKFTTKARNRGITRKEETLMTSSIDAGTAGIHVDVMKFSDIVEPGNIGTPEQMDGVYKSFVMAENLLVGPNYWIDVEGTRYSFGDAYGRIIDSEKTVPAEKKMWNIHVRGCYKKDVENPKFTPEELELPDKKNEKGESIPHWLDVERGFTFDHFEAKRRIDPFIFSTQQLNSPAGGLDGKAIFPVEKGKYPIMISRKNFNENVRVAYYVATIDTAYTKTERSNHSCITIAAFADNGKVYVNEIIHGKFLPDELTTKICELTAPCDALKIKRPFYYGTKLKSIKIEKTGFVVGLMVGLNSYQHMKGVYLPIELLPSRDTNMRKEERIQTALQPFYTSGRLIFLDDIKPWDQLLRELREFPMSQHNDILDTISDLFQQKEWMGREIPKLNHQQFHTRAMERLLGVEDPYDSEDYLTNSDGSRETVVHPQFSRTGGL